MSILAVGSIALDTVETPHGLREEMLGGSATYFSLSASHFTNIRLVGVVGSDFPSDYRAFLESCNIDLDGLQVKPGKTFRWSGEYAGSMNEAQTRATHPNVFKDFSPGLPKNYRSSRWIFLGNIAPELQLRVMNNVANPELMALDTMNFWIEGSNAALHKALKKVDVLLINEKEAKLLSAEDNLVLAAKCIIAKGPKALIIKRGEYGAMLFFNKEWFFVPGFPLLKVVDPTGAGDTFAGGFMGGLASLGRVTRSTLRKAMIYGSAMASYKITDFGPFHMKNIKRKQIQVRFEEFRKMCSLS